MHTNVHCSTIHNTKDMESTQMPINSRLDKENEMRRRWRCRSNSGLQLPVKAQRVSGCHISRRIFIAHRPGDSQV